MSSDDRTLQVEITIDRQRGQRRRPSESKTPDPPRISRIARLMALAIKFQDMVDRGEVRDYADLARLGYVSRANTPRFGLPGATLGTATFGKITSADTPRNLQFGMKLVW
jgi:hypothetical protein